MANTFGNRSFGNKSATSTASKSVGSGSGDSEVILSTGLFTPSNKNSKALATIQVKEAVTIPAGAYINVYQNEQKTEKHPVLRMQVRKAAAK